MKPWVDFGSEICSQLETAKTREWLITNSLGGFASGTIAGLRTRRYHSLLVATLTPPVDRIATISQVDETLRYDGQIIELSCHNFASGAVQPDGYKYIERFYLDGAIPTWIYACAGIRLEKKIWMQPEENTTYIQYSCLSANHPLEIHLDLYAVLRDMHALSHRDKKGIFTTQITRSGLTLDPTGIMPIYILCPNASFTAKSKWMRNLYLPAEAKHGENAIEDQCCIGHLNSNIHPGEALTIVITTEPDANLDGVSSLRARQEYESRLLETGKRAWEKSSFPPESIQQLLLAADQFIVQRPTSAEQAGQSVIAGYPWFTDWGRDTMISLPGLTLATGRPEVSRRILRTFAAYLDEGMLLNRFPDSGNQPEYNTIDATLWYFEALRAYHACTNDDDLLSDLFPILIDIIDWHLRGTRYGIHVDPQDGLLTGGTQSTQLTWMDVKIDGWAVTPRSGKAVEINALWYNALNCTIQFCKQLGKSTYSLEQAASAAKSGFQRFWNPKRKHLFDVLDGPNGSDPTLRPNQIIAAALPNTPLTNAQLRSVVDACRESLLTPFGLRSLAPGEPGYVGRFGGDRHQRDAGYHMGTTWGWLIGPYISAYLRVYENPDIVKALIMPMLDHLKDFGLGSLAEVFDGDAPFEPGGCPAQAWSVAEVLRVIDELNIAQRTGWNR